MVVVPADTPEASPLALIVATAGVDEFQFTWLVMFCVLPSEYVPVAVNCCVASRNDSWIGRSYCDRGQRRRRSSLQHDVHPIVSRIPGLVRESTVCAISINPIASP